jgi:tetratricopeptide (TPR) repeat protein
MHRRSWPAILCIWSSLSAWALAAADDARARTAELLAGLADARVVVREVAESRLSALGTSAVPMLGEALVGLPDRDAQVRLEWALRRVTLPLVQAWRVTAAAGDAAPGTKAGAAAPAQDPLRELLAAGAPAWAILHRTARCSAKRVAEKTEAVLAAAAAELALPSDQAVFERTRYFLAPLLLRRSDAAARARFGEHLVRTLADFRGGTPRVRARAEEELCLLGRPAEEFLTDEARSPDLGRAEREQLLRGVKWCVWPELRARTGMSMDAWEALAWREKADLVPQWRRVAGEDAIPLLERVLAEEREDVVKFAAEIALYELGARDIVSAPAGVPPPEALRVLLLQVWELRRKSEFGRALDLLDMLIRKLPEDREVRVELGVTLRQAKRFDDALREFRTALGLSGTRPNEATVGYHIALTLLQADRFDEAVPEFKKYLAKAGSDAGLERALWYDLACAYALAGKPEDAIDALLAAIAKGYRDREHLTRNDPDLESLRGLPDWRRVLDALDKAEALDREEKAR